MKACAELVLKKCLHSWVGLVSDGAHDGIMEGRRMTVSTKSSHHKCTLLRKEFRKLQLGKVIPESIDLFLGEYGDHLDTVLV